MNPPEALLVIDDDPIFRELVRLCVDGMGVEVLEAGDCARGLEVLREACDRIALVLLDYWMPHMTPVQCSAGIRELVRPSTRVMLVTASFDAKMRASEVGLTEWLSKPIDLKLLERIVLDSFTGLRAAAK